MSISRVFSALLVSVACALISGSNAFAEIDEMDSDPSIDASVRESLEKKIGDLLSAEGVDAIDTSEHGRWLKNGRFSTDEAKAFLIVLEKPYFKLIGELKEFRQIQDLEIACYTVIAKEDPQWAIRRYYQFQRQCEMPEKKEGIAEVNESWVPLDVSNDALPNDVLHLLYGWGQSEPLEAMKWVNLFDIRFSKLDMGLKERALPVVMKAMVAKATESKH